MTTLTPVTVGFERILIPTDFSEASQVALGYAKSIARQYQSHLFLLHVNQLINPITPPEAVWIEEEEIREQVKKQVEQTSEALRSEGFPAEALFGAGLIVDEVLSVIKKNKIDLIVMGTHGKTGLDRFLLGSDAEAVLRQVRCPVLVLGPEVVPATDQAWHPKRLICATTLEPDSAWIAAYAYRLAQQHQADFMLFNVENPGRTEKGADWLLFEKAFKKALPEDADFHISLRTLLSDNLPGHKIADVAREQNADLIVMGARAASAAATHLARGTAPQVFIEAPCPVLTLHSQQ